MTEKGQTIEIFGKRVTIIENAAKGHNWCSMCAFENECCETGKIKCMPCEDANGKTNRFFLEEKQEKNNKETEHGNSKMSAGEWNGKPLFLCGYSFEGFIEDPEERSKMKKKFDYIYENCKYFGFFGEGLCFSCGCPDEKCPFDELFTKTN